MNRYPTLVRDGQQIGLHVHIAEKALGKRLPAGAVVHHVNEDKTDNRNENLVICPDRAYHNLIHSRMRAMDACGNADWVMCGVCKKYDAPEDLYIRYKQGRRANHRACHAERELKRWRFANAR